MNIYEHFLTLCVRVIKPNKKNFLLTKKYQKSGAIHKRINL